MAFVGRKLPVLSAWVQGYGRDVRSTVYQAPRGMVFNIRLTYCELVGFVVVKEKLLFIVLTIGNKKKGV